MPPPSQGEGVAKGVCVFPLGEGDTLGEGVEVEEGVGRRGEREAR